MWTRVEGAAKLLSMIRPPPSPESVTQRPSQRLCPAGHTTAQRPSTQLSPIAQAWEIALLLPELCATPDDAEDERRWMRQKLHAALSAAQQTVLPPSSADVTRNLKALPSDSPATPGTRRR